MTFLASGAKIQYKKYLGVLIANLSIANCNMERKNVILVDDSSVNLKIGFFSLKDNYNVKTIPSGEELLVYLKSEETTPDLILLDIEMPGMDGFETFEKIKTNPKTAEIPVIFLTASNSIEFEERSYRIGATDYMHKPYYPPFLRKRIDLHINVNSINKENLKFREKLQNNQKELEDLQMRLLKTIIELVERRDEVSGGHVERTRKYVEVLLDVLEKNNIYSDIVSSWERDLLLNSTMFYDLGKLSIDNAILTKPDKLKADEYNTIKNHTLMGVKIIDDIQMEMFKNSVKNSTEANILNYAKEFAGYHHEKWDGTGYPNGLKGQNIPLPGRIMAIADVYDALISKRTYNKCYTHEEAAMIISQGKGTHFDPVLVDIFISVEDKFRNIAGNRF